MSRACTKRPSPARSRILQAWTTHTKRRSRPKSSSRRIWKRPSRVSSAFFQSSKRCPWSPLPNLSVTAKRMKKKSAAALKRSAMFSDKGQVTGSEWQALGFSQTFHRRWHDASNGRAGQQRHAAADGHVHSRHIVGGLELVYDGRESGPPRHLWIP